jgi:hypothetical protein
MIAFVFSPISQPTSTITATTARSPGHRPRKISHSSA